MLQLSQVTSESNAGKFVYSVHPNLRKQTDLRFTSLNDLAPCDLLFLALPHGMSHGAHRAVQGSGPGDH